MHVVSVYDLSRKDSLTAAMRMRMNANRPRASPETFEELVNLVGGRLTYMGRVTKAADMLKHARHLLTVEKAWLLSQIGLIPDCDDDVMDEQKWSSCSWLLLREFVKRRREDMEKVKEEIERGEAKPEDLDDLPLPRISYVRVCYSSGWFGANIPGSSCALVRGATDHDACGLHGRCVKRAPVILHHLRSEYVMFRRARPEEHHCHRRESSTRSCAQYR